MQTLRKIIDWTFSSFPSLKEFCFLSLPLALCPNGTRGLFNADIWDQYLRSHPDPLSLLPRVLDAQSKKWVKLLLYRRNTIRYFLTVNEIYRYYKSKRLQIPYWFPQNGSLLKSVFWHHVGIKYVPRPNRDTLKNRIAIDGGPASGDSSIALLECGASHVISFEPSPCQREEMKSVLLRNDMADKIEIIPYALDDHHRQLMFTDQYGKSFIAETMSIDDICEGKDIGCIKLDIEGSEYPAIRGAERTITRCRPILLICVYHRPEDIFEMPAWIQRTFPFYHFCIRDTEPGNRSVGAHLMLIAWPEPQTHS